MTEREQIDSRLRDLIVAVLRADHGDEAIAHQTYGGEIVTDRSKLGVLSWPVPADPLQAVELAGHIERVAHNLWRRYAEQARGAGKTWLELADALGVDREEDERDHQAFVLVAGESGSWYSERYVSWKCGSCGERIRDLGPYGGHPEDCEKGHAETCKRHKAAVAQYQAAWDDDDEGDEG